MVDSANNIGRVIDLKTAPRRSVGQETLRPSETPARAASRAGPQIGPVEELREYRRQDGAEARNVPAVAEIGSAETPSLTGNSGLTTYRDPESGRVVIRVFDKESGDVLIELPPEEQRQKRGFLEPPRNQTPGTIVEA